MKSVINIIVASFLLASCEASTIIQDDNPPSPLRLKLEITSRYINTIPDIEANLIVTNISYNVQTYTFPSSCQLGFTVEKGEDILFNSRYEIACLAVVTELQLAPQESKTYDISLRGMASGDALQKGTYRLNAFLLNEESPKTSITFDVN